jgi:hypothetical protein
VIIRAVKLLALAVLLARVYLEVPRMVLLLFPPVTVSASVFILASIGVRPYKVFYFPILTKLFLIVVQLRFSAQVLPVVGVDTIFFVVVLAPWAPRSFEVKNVKIRIFRLHLMEQVYRDFFI